ncbi:MAG: FHA domain-containing protein [Saccharofermentanales bacterium]|jgi:hypothetical protein
MKQCENGHFFDEERYENCPYCNPGQNIGKTAGVVDLGKTMPLQNNPAQVQADTGKTVALIKKDLGINPAVAFVVCIRGIHRGSDFRLCSGRNFIGRSAAMDVSLPDDDTVSRENHCLITYDSKSGRFTLVPGMSRGITYLNGEPVEATLELKAYDRIELGQTVLLFLPLCGEHFKWENDEE